MRVVRDITWLRRSGDEERRRRRKKRGAAYRAIFSLSIRKVTCLFESSVLVSFHHRPIRIQKSCDEVSRARARGARVTQLKTRIVSERFPNSEHLRCPAFTLPYPDQITVAGVNLQVSTYLKRAK